MLQTALVFLIVFFGWICAVNAIRQLAVPALRTGVLQARGRTYRRDKEPVRFWLGVFFWMALFALFSFGVVVGANKLYEAFVERGDLG